jgi:WD40 repeat protein
MMFKSFFVVRLSTNVKRFLLVKNAVLIFGFLIANTISINAEAQDSLVKGDSFKQVLLKEHLKNPEAVCYSPLGNYLATAGQDKIINLYKLDKEGKPSFLHKLEFHKAPVTTLMFSKDGNFLLSAGKDFKACVWRVDSAELKNVFDIGFQPVNDAGMDASARLIYTVSDDKKLRIFDRVDPKFSREFTLTDVPTAVLLSPNRKNFYVGTLSGRILVLDMSGKETRSFVGHTQKINSLDITPEGTQLLSAGDDKKAIIWNVANGKVSADLTGHKWKVNVARFSAKGLYVATGSNDGEVFLWDTKSSTIIQTFAEVGTNIRCLSFSHDISNLAVASHSKSEPSVIVISTGLRLPSASKPASPQKPNVAKGIPENKAVKK